MDEAFRFPLQILIVSTSNGIKARAIDLETHEIQNLPATSDARYRYVVISHGKFIYSFGRHIKPEGGMDSMNSCER